MYISLFYIGLNIVNIFSLIKFEQIMMTSFDFIGNQNFDLSLRLFQNPGVWTPVASLDNINHLKAG